MIRFNIIIFHCFSKNYNLKVVLINVFLIYNKTMFRVHFFHRILKINSMPWLQTNSNQLLIICILYMKSYFYPINGNSCEKNMSWLAMWVLSYEASKCTHDKNYCWSSFSCVLAPTTLVMNSGLYMGRFWHLYWVLASFVNWLSTLLFVFYISLFKSCFQHSLFNHVPLYDWPCVVHMHWLPWPLCKTHDTLKKIRVFQFFGTI